MDGGGEGMSAPSRRKWAGSSPEAHGGGGDGGGWAAGAGRGGVALQALDVQFGVQGHLPIRKPPLLQLALTISAVCVRTEASDDERTSPTAANVVRSTV